MALPKLETIRNQSVKSLQMGSYLWKHTWGQISVLEVKYVRVCIFERNHLPSLSLFFTIGLLFLWRDIVLRLLFHGMTVCWSLLWLACRTSGVEVISLLLGRYININKTKKRWLAVPKINFRNLTYLLCSDWHSTHVDCSR